MSNRIYFECGVDKYFSMSRPLYAMKTEDKDIGSCIAKAFERANKGKAFKVFSKDVGNSRYELLFTREARKKFGGGYVVIGSIHVEVLREEKEIVKPVRSHSNGVGPVGFIKLGVLPK